MLFRLLSASSVIARKLDSHAHPPFKLPSSKNNRWVERQPFNKMYEYTTDPLPFPKTGGRGPNGMYCHFLITVYLELVWYTALYFLANVTGIICSDFGFSCKLVEVDYSYKGKSIWSVPLYRGLNVMNNHKSVEAFSLY